MMAEDIRIGKRETMAEASAQALIRYIANNGLKAGDKLPSEHEMMDMTGISRMPLREGLSMLRALGIVEARQGRGVFVKALDMATVFAMLSPLLKVQADINVKDIFAVRVCLEASIAENAATNRTDENLAALQAALDGMRENHKHDRQAYIEHDMAFHQELARSTGNPIFHVVLASITDLLSQVQFMYRDKVEYRALALAEHEQVLDAVRQGNAEEAGAAMEKHIRNAVDRI